MCQMLLLNQCYTEPKLLSPSCSVTELSDITALLGFIPGSGKGARLSMHGGWANLCTRKEHLYKPRGVSRKNSVLTF